MIKNYYENIYLDVLNENHLEFMLRCRNDLRVWSWTRQDDLLMVENHKKWFESLHNSKTNKMYAVMTNDGRKEIVGVCGLTDIRWTARNAEFSLYIDPELHGKGFGTKALQVLLKYAFEQQNMYLIYGEAFADNVVACHVYEKIGFKKEGLMRNRYYRNGKYHDSIPLSITREEWEATQQKKA